jgi:iron uptake system EfeUOB component EfeO/EfeM
LFAVWCLYKPNYKNFEEITEYFDRLDPQLQQQIGAAFSQLQELILYVSQFKIPRERFDQLSPKQIKELADQVRTNFPGFLQLLQAGQSVREILEHLGKNSK